MTPTKKAAGDKEEVVVKPQKKTRRKNEVSRKAGNALMKGVDVLKLRSTHNRINTKITKFQDTLNKKLKQI